MRPFSYDDDSYIKLNRSDDSDENLHNLLSPSESSLSMCGCAAFVYFPVMKSHAEHLFVASAMRAQIGSIGLRNSAPVSDFLELCVVSDDCHSLGHLLSASYGETTIVTAPV
jgi:hypothetical protein